jgi:hypothetical protein
MVAQGEWPDTGHILQFVIRTANRSATIPQSDRFFQ